MGVTKKSVKAIALGIIILLLAQFLELEIFIFVIYNLILMFLIIFDFLKTLSKKDFDLERLDLEMLQLFEKEKVQISIYNKSKNKVHFKIRHEFSDKLMPLKQEDTITIEGHCKKIIDFYIKPLERGIFKLDYIFLRVEGPLGFSTKDITFKLDKNVKVYPSLRALKEYNWILKNEGIDFLGKHIIKKKVEGKEFESLRQYKPTDDIKKINWRQSAKKSELIVNQFEPQNNQNVYILIDSGRSMSYKLKEIGKIDLAINAAVFLSEVVLKNKDKSGLMVFNTKVDSFLKASSGFLHQKNLMQNLYLVKESKQTSNYNLASLEFLKREKKKSLVCIFTDFQSYDEFNYFQSSLMSISKKHYVLIFLVKDKRRDELLKNKSQTKSDIFEKAILYNFLHERNKMIRKLRSKNILCIECDEEEIFLKAVNAYMQFKNKDVF